MSCGRCWRPLARCGSLAGLTAAVSPFHECPYLRPWRVADVDGRTPACASLGVRDRGVRLAGRVQQVCDFGVRAATLCWSPVPRQLPVLPPRPPAPAVSAGQQVMDGACGADIAFYLLCRMALRTANQRLNDLGFRSSLMLIGRC
jgi:hypothetical protein